MQLGRIPRGFSILRNGCDGMKRFDRGELERSLQRKHIVF